MFRWYITGKIQMKKTKFKFGVSFAMAFAVSITVLFLSGCKKNDEGKSYEKDIIGTWYYECSVGEDGVLTTTLEFADNGEAHLRIVSSGEGEEEVFEVTAAYDVPEENILRYAYDYEDKGDESGVIYYDNALFEVKGDYLLFYEGTTTGTECWIYSRQK